jgi:hypothetical protein
MKMFLPVFPLLPTLPSYTKIKLPPCKTLCCENAFHMCISSTCDFAWTGKLNKSSPPLPSSGTRGFGCSQNKEMKISSRFFACTNRYNMFYSLIHVI